MGMSATNVQIVELAKRGFEPPQIANALGLSVENVQAVLSQDSGAMKEVSKALSSQFDNLQDTAIKGLEHLAKFAENEGVRLKALAYILDHQLGLKKPAERLTVTNNFQFMVERAEKARQVRNQTVLDVESKVVEEDKQLPLSAATEPIM